MNTGIPYIVGTLTHTCWSIQVKLLLLHALWDLNRHVIDTVHHWVGSLSSLLGVFFSNFSKINLSVIIGHLFLPITIHC